MAISPRETEALSSFSARAAEERRRADAFEALAAKELARLLYLECGEDAEPSLLRERLAEEAGRLGLPVGLCAVELVGFFGSARALLPETPMPFPQKPRVCYVKSGNTAEAAERSGITADWFYAENFGEAASRTEDGEREACLLPIMNEDRHPMVGILRLAEEYGLYRAAVLRMATETQSGSYALYTGRLYDMPGADTLELSLLADAREVGGFEEIARRFSCRCLPLFDENGQQSDGGCLCRLRLQGEKDGLYAASAAIALTKDCAIVGIWKETDVY